MKLHIDFACSPILLCGRLYYKHTNIIGASLPALHCMHRYRWYQTCIDVHIALGCISSIFVMIPICMSLFHAAKATIRFHGNASKYI